MNAVVLAVSLVLILSLFRVNVILSLCLGALAGGVWAGLTFLETVDAFQNGLSGGATIALSYGLLGAFAVAISRSGITDVLARLIIEKTGRGNSASEKWIKSILITSILLIAISSQNIIPIHIAFIPIVIPPLLAVFAQLQVDRRLIACVITFGLATPFLILPVGFGGIYLFEILHKNLQSNGLIIEASDVPLSMLISACGMLAGLLIAVFFTYRKPRHYDAPEIAKLEPALAAIDKKSLAISLIAIASALSMQLYSNSMIMGALTGILIFTVSGVVKWNQTQDLFSRGIAMMAMIGFIMITASGFAEVMKTTGSISDLVSSTSGALEGSKAMAAIMMLVIG